MLKQLTCVTVGGMIIFGCFPHVVARGVPLPAFIFFPGSWGNKSS